MTHNNRIKKLELIINFFANGRRAKYEEIEDYLESQEQWIQARDERVTLAKSIRTFQRDKDAIARLFGVNIEYDRKDKVYYIEHREELNTDFSRIFELSELMQLLQASELHKDYIKLEKSEPKGLHHINTLIQAIRKQKAIQIEYKKYTDQDSKTILAHPIIIKEYKNRWYAIVAEDNDPMIKTYALDRINNISITNIKSPKNNLQMLDDTYEYAYGISSHKPIKKITEVLLEFTYEQGHYIKSLPLHPTQIVVSESKVENSCVISLQVTTSTELIMDILSYGDKVKVIQPKSLAQKIKKIAEDIVRKYNAE